MASWLLQSLSRPRRVCGNRSSVRHSTSWRTPPTLMQTRRFRARLRMIMNGSGGSDVIEREWYWWWINVVDAVVVAGGGGDMTCTRRPAADEEASAAVSSSRSSSSSRSVSLPEKTMTPAPPSPAPLISRLRLVRFDMFGVLDVIKLLLAGCWTDFFFSERWDRRLQLRQ